MSHDKQFFQTFATIIVVLHVLAFVLLVLANALDPDAYAGEGNAYAQQEIVKRIQSPGQVAVSGDGGGAPAAVISPIVASTATVATPAAGLGKQTYDNACFACHGTGAAGAPRIGDTADWNARIAVGRDTLIQHAIEGYMGERGYMPAKGGQMQLSDEAVIAALDYMIEQSK